MIATAHPAARTARRPRRGRPLRAPPRLLRRRRAGPAGGAHRTPSPTAAGSEAPGLRRRVVPRRRDPVRLHDPAGRRRVVALRREGARRLPARRHPGRHRVHQGARGPPAPARRRAPAPGGAAQRPRGDDRRRRPARPDAVRDRPRHRPGQPAGPPAPRRPPAPSVGLRPVPGDPHRVHRPGQPGHDPGPVERRVLRSGPAACATTTSRRPAAGSRSTRRRRPAAPPTTGSSAGCRPRSPHPNTGRNIDTPNRLATREAILAADPYVDYASYDVDRDGVVSNVELHLTVVAAGQEASYDCCSGAKIVWGHRWALYGDEVPTRGRRAGRRPGLHRSSARSTGTTSPPSGSWCTSSATTSRCRTCTTSTAPRPGWGTGA